MIHVGKEGFGTDTPEPDDRLKSGESLAHRFVQSIRAYLQDAQRADILRPHQRDVFEDFQRFFEEGSTRGYIELPTGTGKTVLFVELSKALLSSEHEDRPRPKILVVVPTKDLVYQTIGRAGERGYGKFAPQLRVGSYFSDTPAHEKTGAALETYDVVITTYRSFTLLSRKQELRRPTNFDQDVLKSNYFAELVMHHGYDYALYLARMLRGGFPTGRMLLDKFDVLILDEAHHIFGGEMGRIVDSLSKDNVVIGFTATPDASEIKRLRNYLPNKIHELELNEAIWLGLLASVLPIGIKSGIRIRGSNLYDELGDFIDSRIRYLAHDTERNRIILDAAKTLVHSGIGTIISCIAGDEAWHARYLAERLNTEGISAEAVHSGVHSEQRQRLYKLFESGEIDVLTFIGVLGEGWDSDRAKALICARPTRSVIFSKQRLGRITRPSGTAIAIDIFDEYEDRNPAITVADALGEGNMPFGTMVGIAEDESIVRRVLESLKENMPTMPILQSNYQSYQELLSSLEVLERGVLGGADRRGVPEYALPSVLSTTYRGVTEEILTKIEELTGRSIDKKLARQGNSIRTVYKVDQVSQLLNYLPMVVPRRYYTDRNNVQWISPEGIVLLFRKRFPGLTVQIVEDQLKIIEEQLDWTPARYQSNPEQSKYRLFTVIKMYESGQQTTDLLNQAFVRYFAAFFPQD